MTHSQTIVQPNYIQVTPPCPRADFKYELIKTSKHWFRKRVTIKFLDQSTGSVNQWQWSFGNGKTSSERNPTMTFKRGVYTITLIAKNNYASNTQTKVGLIKVD